MKKMMFLMAMISGIIAISGCEKTPEGPDQKDPVLQTFEVSVDAVSRTAVTYSVTPTLNDKEYVVVVKTAESVAGLEDEALVEKIFDEIEASAASSGNTLAEQMNKIACKGAVKSAEVKGLAVNTAYVLVVFGVDPAQEWASTTFPVVKEFSTQPVNKVDCTFDVTATVEMNTVDFTVSPSDKNIRWHLLTVMKSMYDGYIDPAGDYRWDTETFYQAYAENEMSQYLGAGYSEEEVLQIMYLQGDQNLHAEGLNTQTEYVYLVAGFDIDADNIFLVTDVTVGSYVTENVAKSSMTFDISVTDIEQVRAAIKITPSTDDETFCWMCQPYDGVQTPDEVMDNIVAANKMWFDMGFMLYKGVQDYTGGPESQFKYKLDMPDTEYCVIAFGYAGGVTTDPEMVTFRTLPGGAPEDCVFEANVTDVTPYTVDFEVVPTDNTVYYTADICVAAEYNEVQVIGDIENGIQQMVQMQQMFDPNATVTQVIGMYYWSGANSMGADGLSPDTEYMLYVCALDAKTGKVAAIQTFDPFVKTSPLGNTVPTIELVGYYSGDDEAGAIFGQPDATAGKSIAVVKYGAPADATAVFSSIITGDATDLSVYDDAYLMGMIGSSYWSQMDMTQPYSFFVLNWEEDNTVVSYAEDAAGNLGVLARKLIRATAQEKGNIDDLKALVDELNSKTRTTRCAASVEFTEAKPKVTLKGKADVAGRDFDVEAPAMIAAPQSAIKAGHIMMLDHVAPYWTR